MDTSESWPTDPRKCHDLLNRFVQQVESLKVAMDQSEKLHNQKIEDLQAALDESAKIHDQTFRENEQLVAELRHQLDLYRRYAFGQLRERFVEAPGQGHLFELDPVESIAALPEPPAPERSPTPRPRRSRKPDYDRLTQVRFEHDVPEAEKICAHCGEGKARIGRMRHACWSSSRTALSCPSTYCPSMPALIAATEWWPPKHTCSHCCDGVVAPDGPPRPVTGCIAGTGLLAEVVVSKFAEHVPHYRLEDISTRYDLYLPRSTLCDWVGNVANLLNPLYQIQKELVQTAPVIWTGDTHVTLLCGEEPGSRKGQFWVYIGPAAFTYDVYDFAEDRKRDGPSWFLANYAGYLQADAFSGYDGICAGGQILEVARWAHARREFLEARLSSPAEASLIRRLYEVENRVRPLNDIDRLALRQSEAVQILERIRQELARLSSRLLPKSGLAQAVTYALNEWQSLCRYTEDGRLTIDNNASDRRLRDQAIGRKNWLFLGSAEAGPRAAVLCTILAGAKRHRLEPWAYLRDVILQLSVDASPEALARLLPDRWAQRIPITS